MYTHMYTHEEENANDKSSSNPVETEYAKSKKIRCKSF